MGCPNISFMVKGGVASAVPNNFVPNQLSYWGSCQKKCHIGGVLTPPTSLFRVSWADNWLAPNNY